MTDVLEFAPRRPAPEQEADPMQVMLDGIKAVAAQNAALAGSYTTQLTALDQRVARLELAVGGLVVLLNQLLAVNGPAN